MLIDVQNTFCIPDFELYVGGRSGRGAVEDNARLCQFIYHNLGRITKITATMDTHVTMQVFHAIFFIDKDDVVHTIAIRYPDGGVSKSGIQLFAGGAGEQ